MNSRSHNNHHPHPQQPGSTTSEATTSSTATRNRFYKTRLCPFHFKKEAKARCRGGSECTYAHSWEELRPSVDLTKTKLCAEYINGWCQKRAENCPFAHGPHDLRSPDSVRHFSCIAADGKSPVVEEAAANGGSRQPQQQQQQQQRSTPPPHSSSSGMTAISTTPSSGMVMPPPSSCWLDGWMEPLSLPARACTSSSVDNNITSNRKATDIEGDYSSAPFRDCSWASDNFAGDDNNNNGNEDVVLQLLYDVLEAEQANATHHPPSYVGRQEDEKEKNDLEAAMQNLLNMTPAAPPAPASACYTNLLEQLFPPPVLPLQQQPSDIQYYSKDAGPSPLGPQQSNNNNKTMMMRTNPLEAEYYSQAAKQQRHHHNH